jgi:Protein of unknown function (DUF3828)
MTNRFGASLFATAILALAAVIPASAQSTPATNVVRHLYDWYFGAQRHRPGMWMNDLVHARPSLDPALYALLRAGVTYDNDHHSADILDFDPFVAAQIDASSYAVGPPAGSGDRVVVPVTLTYRHGGKNVVRVIVQREGTSYRVYDIEGKDYALRSLLTMNLKRVHASP